ncbi:MAG TPA: shikimate kinase [Alphaproteobacteria bacterium]|nr:shikimate kinase [Alphaproteobacteria bacterium]
MSKSLESKGLDLHKSLVLVGMPGVGKTSVGRILAGKLGLPFLDADAEIETAAQSTIEEIFARDGEAAFRTGERRVIARLLEGPVAVIATGGGAFMSEETRRRVAERGISLWLRADIELLLKRVARRKDRPLLKTGDVRETLTRLFAEREPVYATADITVDSGEQSAEAVADKAIAALEAHLSAPTGATP